MQPYAQIHALCLYVDFKLFLAMEVADECVIWKRPIDETSKASTRRVSESGNETINSLLGYQPGGVLSKIL